MEVCLSHAGSAPVPSSSLLEWNWSSSAHVRDRGRVRISEYVLHDTAVCLCDVSGLKTIDIACHVMVTNVEMLQHFGSTRARFTASSLELSSNWGREHGAVGKKNLIL